MVFLLKPFQFTSVLTYTFVYVSFDGDERVGQSTGAALVYWLWRCVAAENSLDVEPHQQVHEAAHLPLLVKTCKYISIGSGLTGYWAVQYMSYNWYIW